MIGQINIFDKVYYIDVSDEIELVVVVSKPYEITSRIYETRKVVDVIIRDGNFTIPIDELYYTKLEAINALKPKLEKALKTEEDFIASAHRIRKALKDKLDCLDRQYEELINNG